MVKLAELKEKALFGEVLVERGIISPEELSTARNLQRQSREKLGKLLIDMGALSETDLVRHLSEYLEIPYVVAENFPTVPVVENTFSVQFMRECKFVPVAAADGELTIAMVDPLDRSTLDAIRLYTRYGRVAVVLAPESEILDLIERFYGNQASSLGRIVEGIDTDVEGLGEDTDDVEHLKDLASEAPVIRLVNLILSRAIESRASDIHIEPFEPGAQGALPHRRRPL